MQSTASDKLSPKLSTETHTYIQAQLTCTHTKGIWFLFFAVCLPVTPGNDVGMADTV